MCAEQLLVNGEAEIVHGGESLKIRDRTDENGPGDDLLLPSRALRLSGATLISILLIEPEYCVGFQAIWCLPVGAAVLVNSL